ncbi:MAG: hypothetical protein MRY83_07770, partial [Flavobacteriales bacterium]|nr:hypothetical protein [Flavobacteriales bacterium]
MSIQLCGQVYDYKLYGSREGLPNLVIHDIEQLKSGELCLGSAKGVIFFDGVNVEHLDYDQGLSDNLVHDVIEDDSGKVWVATNNGLSVIDRSSDSVKIFTKDNGLSDNVINKVLLDSNILWIATNNGLTKYVDGRFLPNFYRNQIGNNQITDIILDTRGNFWIASESGVFCIENYRSKYFKKSKTYLSDVHIAKLLEDSKGNIWFGGYGTGLYCLRNGEMLHYTTENVGLLSSYVGAMMEDGDENIWVGALSGGGMKFSIKNFASDTIIRISQVYQQFRNIQSGLLDEEGNLWIGTYGKGLVRFDNRNYEIYTEEDGIKDEFIWSIEGYEDDILLAHDNGISIIHSALNNSKNDVSITNSFGLEAFEGIRIYHLNRIGRNTFAASTYNGLYFFEMEKNGCRILGHFNRFLDVSASVIRSTCKLSDGRIAVATDKGAFILRMGPTFENIKDAERISTDNGLPHNHVVKIDQNENELIIATLRGLCIVGENEKNIFTAEQGLAHDNIRDFERIGDNLILATGSGLSFVDLKTWQIKNIGVNSGLSSGRVYFVEADGNQDLWIGHNLGIDKLNYN